MRLLGKALTFDDVLLVPAYSQVLPKDTSLATQFSRNIQLNLPLVSAAMDTVTEARLAIAIAQEGGIGIIHKNLTPQEQAAQVAKVKRYESGVLRDPVVISPQTTIRQVMKLSDELGISGFPVVDAGKVVGIVTGRDLRFETRYDLPVSEIMTPRERLITMPDGTTPAEAKTLLNKHKLERLLLVNDGFELKGLITVKDITKQLNFPNAARDAVGPPARGRCGGRGRGHRRARRSAGQGRCGRHRGRHRARPQQGRDRPRALGQAELPAGRRDRRQHRHRRRGHGAGRSRCRCASRSASARAPSAPPASWPAWACRRSWPSTTWPPRLQGTGVPMIADGGIRYSGDIAKAIAAGANTVMMGGMFAGTEEAPGEIVLYQGRSYKSYRGMGSIGAMQQGSADRYFQESSTGNPNADKLVPEGIEGRVPYKGSVVAIIFQMAGGLRASMGYCGCPTIEHMRNKAEFVEITSAGIRESHVHDVQITKEAPNYRAD